MSNFTSSENNEKIAEILKENFYNINEEKINSWEKILSESNLPYHNFNITDSDILNIDPPDPKTQKLIIGDIDRTKVKEKIILPSFKDYCFQFVTFYLKQNNIDYKQGLNEIVATFILLKAKVNISFKRIYKLFTLFIDKFLSNYYWEEDFFSLKSSLSLLNLLLKYHCPEIYNLFDFLLITPEIYATSWILTLFSNKSSLNLIYHLWDKLILFNDNLLLHFFMIAFIIYNKDKILKHNDITIIPGILTNLNFNSCDEIDNILELAMDLYSITPYSFRIFANELNIFNCKSEKLEELYLKFCPQNQIVLPIFPNEILSICYKDIIGCCNEKCINFNLKNKKDKKLKECNKCLIKNDFKNNSYIIIDLRLLENKNENEDNFSGFLPMTFGLNEEDEKDINFPNNLIKKLIDNDCKNNYHFIIISNETDYFQKYENEFYSENDKVNKNCVGIITKADKELNINKINNVKSDKRKIRELYKFKKIIEEMINNNFKYISYAYGGFKDIHEYCIKYNLSLIGHGKNCILCKKEKKGVFNSFSKFFFKEKNGKNNIIKNNKKNRNIQINENLNLLKEKLNIDDINKILIDCSIAQFTCLCKKNIFEKNENNNIINSIKTENIINNNNNNKNNNKEILNNDIYDEESIMLFVSLNGIFFYKEDFNEKNDNLIYKLIKTIPLDTLISINKKNNYGNLLNIIFYENKKQICSINIDFESPINSHNFKKTILQMKQIQILNK